MFQSDKKSNTLGSILDPNIEINGDINVSANLIVYGKINGNVISTETINTAKDSIINGNLIAKEAVISGTLKGDLEVSGKVVLTEDSNLLGNLKASIIVIEEGAKFDGMCQMIKQQVAESKVKKIDSITS
ncbi:MAG: hypothetical protein CMG64_00995 [Candidatus Marinimicrobia bacterium]|nr:hypothetical protein [Candidatus Neomarinimicrobiota bacterium]|tara:strand:+ start:17035 stop:17424 length:390 start_codon:yes stop_codon:yes gene_type:complete